MVVDTYHLEWNPSIVCISFGISFLGSSCALNLSEQYRLTSLENSPKLYNKTILSLIWSGAIGSVAMWAIQLIAVRAIDLIDPNGNKINPRYRLDLLLVSLVVLTLGCKIAIMLSTRDEIYAINKVEELEVYIRDSNNLTIGEMKQTKNRNSIIFRTLFKGTIRIFRGGVMFCAAFILATYVAITSLVIDECTIEWNAGPLVGILIAMLASCNICVWIIFRLLALYPHLESLRLLCSISCAAAICALHYLIIGTAITFVHTPGKTFPSYLTFSQYDVYNGVIVGSLIYSCIVLLVALADTRSWFYRLSKSSRAIDEKIMNIIAQLNALKSSNDSHKNAVLFINEFEKFETDYKILKGDEECLDAKKYGLSTIHIDRYHDDTHVTTEYSNFTEKSKSSHKSSFLNKVLPDISEGSREESEHSNPTGDAYCIDL
jgi:NO-binding membrane sensor protein with MHYT domain